MNRTDVKLASPCSLDWKSMTPAEGGRFCGDCKKVVRNLSGMSEREARALLQSAGNGELCVRYVYDAQGRVFFGGDELLSPSLLSRAKRVATVAAIAATAACSSELAPFGALQQEQHAEQTPEQDQQFREAMGGVSSNQVNQWMAPFVDAGADAEGDAAHDGGTDGG